MPEEGKVKSLREIAEKEKVDNSYVSRMVNLTLLAPDIVVAILDDQLREGISLFDVAVGWNEQRLRIDYAWSGQNKQSCHQPPFEPVDGRLPTHSGQWAFLSERHVSPRKRTIGLEDRDTDSNSGTIGNGIEHV